MSSQDIRSHHVSQVHHDHAVAKVFDDLQVVRYKHQRETELFAEIHQQIQNLSLDRHVQC